MPLPDCGRPGEVVKGHGCGCWESLEIGLRCSDGQGEEVKIRGGTCSCQMGQESQQSRQRLNSEAQGPAGGRKTRQIR